MSILISDIGSSKSSWALISEHSTKRFETVGFNPNYQSKIEIENILKLVFNHFSNDQPKSIFLYGAGIDSSESKIKLKDCFENVFNPTLKLEIENDLLAAARCCFKNNEDHGVIAILGTGSNVREFKNGQLLGESNSLGFILGDEGGGVGFGKYICKAFVYKELSQEVNQHLIDLNFSKQNIIEAIYHKPYPQKYLANFARILFPFKDFVDVKQLLKKNFDDFLTSHVLKIENIQNKDLKFVGSMAYYFQDILKETALKHNLVISEIQQNPLNGLIEYHKKHI